MALMLAGGFAEVRLLLLWLLLWMDGFSCQSNKSDYSELLLFLHPQKSGGTFLCRALLSSNKFHIGPHQNCNPIVKGMVWNSIPMNYDLSTLARFWINEGKNFLASEYKPLPHSFNLISSTFHEQPAARMWNIISIVRHPVERVVSHYYYEHLHVAYGSIIDWAHKAPYYTQNYYVRLFSGFIPKGASLAADYRWTDYDIQEPIPKFWRNSKSVMMTENELSLAKIAVRNLAAVVLLEHMDESLIFLQDMLRINISESSTASNPDYRNIRSTRRNITNKEYEELASLNELDLKLYKYVKNNLRFKTIMKMIRGLV